MSSIDASPPPRRCATRTHRRAARREVDGGGRQAEPRQGVRYRLGPRESQPRRWIGGGRMYLLGEITHQTHASGEVAAQPLGVIEGFENVG